MGVTMDWLNDDPYESGEDQDYLSAFRRQRMMPEVNIQDSDPYKRYQQMLEQDSPGSAILRHQQDTMPREEDHQLSTVRKILAAISGFGAGMKDPSTGVSIAQKLTRQPYEREMERWHRENELTGKRASIEDSEYNKRLQAAGNDVREERLRQGLGSKNAKDEEMLRLQGEDRKRRQQKDLETEERDKQRLNFEKQRLDEQKRHNTEVENQRKQKQDQPISASEAARELKGEEEIDARLNQLALQELRKDPGFNSLIVPHPEKEGKFVVTSEAAEKNPKLAQLLKTAVELYKSKNRQGYISKLNRSGNKYKLMPDIWVPEEGE